MLVKFEPCLLENVGCILSSWAERMRDRIDQPLVPRNEIFPGVMVAFDAALD
jgi:hypothetical protein